MKQDFETFDSYESFLRGRLAPWSRAQRIVLAAAMGERWLPVYEQFSRSEAWGNVAILRQSLDAAWNNVTAPASVNWAHLKAQLHEVTPHMDDFDANEALCTCVIVHYTIQCCSEAQNDLPAIMAVLSGLEAIQPDLLTGDGVPARMWKQAAVHKEIARQLRLIERIEALENVQHARQALQALLADPAMRGELRPLSKKRQPAGRTNQELYEQYRQIILLDIKRAVRDPHPRSNPQLATILYLSAWMGRYSRRKQILSGEYGPLEDQPAVSRLLAKNRARDLASPGIADWAPEARFTIEMCYQNSFNGLDAATPESPHAYGPSLRRLWLEARQRGGSQDDAWEAAFAWARHQPQAWSEKGKQKKDLAVLQDYFGQALQWVGTDNLAAPWTLVKNGANWAIRINDFPDESMYTLTVDGNLVGNFHDWPKAWQRG